MTAGLKRCHKQLAFYYYALTPPRRPPIHALLLKSGLLKFDSVTVVVTPSQLHGSQCQWQCSSLPQCQWDGAPSATRIRVGRAPPASGSPPSQGNSPTHLRLGWGGAGPGYPAAGSHIHWAFCRTVWGAGFRALPHKGASQYILPWPDQPHTARGRLTPAGMRHGGGQHAYGECGRAARVRIRFCYLLHCARGGSGYISTLLGLPGGPSGSEAVPDQGQPLF